MRRIPSHSADVEEQREAKHSAATVRDADLVPAADQAARADSPATDRAPSPSEVPVRPHECNDGWLGEAAAGHPRPCTTCLPYLGPCSSCGGSRRSCASRGLIGGRRCCSACTHVAARS